MGELCISNSKELSKTHPQTRHDRCRGTERLVSLAKGNQQHTPLLLGGIRLCNFAKSVASARTSSNGRSSLPERKQTTSHSRNKIHPETDIRIHQKRMAVLGSTNTRIAARFCNWGHRLETGMELRISPPHNPPFNDIHFWKRDF